MEKDEETVGAWDPRVCLGNSDTHNSIDSSFSSVSFRVGLDAQFILATWAFVTVRGGQSSTHLNIDRCALTNSLSGSADLANSLHGTPRLSLHFSRVDMLTKGKPIFQMKGQ